MAGRPATAPRHARVVRFGATERNLHTIHASAFVVMLLTGLVLYLPLLAQVVSSRPLTKAIHLGAAAAWLTALALVALLGDRSALRRTRRELERFDAHDLRWLRRRPATAGRFNAGQKAHAIAEAALAVLFSVSGALLWLGERKTDLRLPGTIALHDASMIVAVVLVAGHVWISLSPGRSASVEGILRGTVPAAWATEHHPRWVLSADPPSRGTPPGPLRLVGAAVVLAAGVASLSMVLCCT
ncbi:MAG TPA: cytochrome b/b6 domain-containing protein [Solirubrobacteraceae bacterium]|jgi:formate dehydrogenase subunit gamma|nr:cytochrome b/b6 domain-containing protein [Solirubrobacteraceae bacterium]